jgi:Mrp family chromosome partitioning ATPase
MTNVHEITVTDEQADPQGVTPTQAVPPAPEVYRRKRGAAPAEAAPAPGRERFAAPQRRNGCWVSDELIVTARRVWQRLDFAPGSATLAVTSAVRREGRTTVAAGLAMARADVAPAKTVLVELDLAKPSFAQERWTSSGPGVADVLRGSAPLVECIEWVTDDLGILPAGEAGEREGDLASPAAVSAMLRELRALADVVVADLPPLAPSGNADSICGLFDSVLLVVRAGATPLPTVQQAVDSMDRAPSVFLNRTSSSVPRWLRRRMGG